MLLDIVKKGSTDRSVTIRIVDSSTFLPEEGVTSATSGLALWYRREGEAKQALDINDLSTLADEHNELGMLHIDDGYYRVDLPDAAFATGANHVEIGGTVTGMLVHGGRIRLVDYDLEQPRHELLFTTVSSVNSQTSLVLATGSTVNDAYKGMIAIIKDTTTMDYPHVVNVVGYTGSTKTLVLETAPSWTIATADKVVILPAHPFAQEIERIGVAHTHASSSGSKSVTKTRT